MKNLRKLIFLALLIAALTALAAVSASQAFATAERTYISVLHRDEDTGAVLKQIGEYVNPGEYGPYEVMTFPGYKPGYLAPNSDPASGTIGAGERRNITYLYSHTAGKATIYVVHKDDRTGAVLQKDGYIVDAGDYGPYEPVNFPGYGTGAYTYGNSYPYPYSAPSGKIFTGETKTILFLYREGEPRKGIIIVERRDKDTMELLQKEKFLVSPGAYRDYLDWGTYQPIPGYLSSSRKPAPDSAPLRGTIESDQTLTVILLYEKDPAQSSTIHVLHRDRDTGAILRTDTHTILAGNYGPYNATVFTGYGAGTLASNSAPASGTAGARQSITITYVYSNTLGKATIYVVHKDRETGAILKRDAMVVQGGQYGPYGAETFADYWPGYLASNSAPASGSVTGGQAITITYLYSYLGRTTVYVVHKDRDTGAVLQSDTHDVDPGDYGPYNATVFSGYGAGTRAANSAPASGTIGAGQTVTVTYLYNYTLGKATIYVVHKDRDTGTVLQWDAMIADGGQYGPYGAASFTGYGPGYLASNSAPASGSISGGQTLTITYLYSGKAVVYVVHKDRITGAILQVNTYNIAAGNYGPYSEMTFEDYWPGYLAFNSAPAAGTVSSGQAITITYLYSYLGKTTVYVAHKDRDTGAVLQLDTHDVDAGDYGPYNATVFPGYGTGTRAANSAPASGTIDAGQTVTITYLYNKIPEVVASEAASDVVSLEADESGEGLGFEGEEPTSDGEESELGGDESELEGEELASDGEESRVESQSEGEGLTSDGEESEFEGEEFTLDGEELEFTESKFSFDDVVSGFRNKESVVTSPAIIVIHMDQDTEEILWQDDYIVAAGLYGPYEPYELPGYGPGLLSEDGAPASGDIGAGEIKIILYLYSRSVDGGPAKGAYTVEFVSEDAGFVFEDAGVVLEETGSDETGFVFE